MFFTNTIHECIYVKYMLFNSTIYIISSTKKKRRKTIKTHAANQEGVIKSHLISQQTIHHLLNFVSTILKIQQVVTNKMCQQNLEKISNTNFNLKSKII